MPTGDVSPLKMAPGSEPWVAVLLMWLGYSLAVGLAARAVVPLPRPLGTFATVLIGLVGVTMGPLALEWGYFRQTISPLRPEAFVAAVAVSVLVLLAYRFSMVLGRQETTSRRSPGEKTVTERVPSSPPQC
ncbi:MAG: hypothetical protein NZ899_10650 [Thermoguttaceae bacterium]|nr:hypothetical protein [Thermoguttaceae bacterium]MDW8078927.1 hypothetical protein [Thermoguttaceae bacterium]